MDDGSSPLWTGIVLILFVIINGILYGFGSAIQKVSESEIEKKAQEGDEKSQWLLSVIDSPARVINTTLISSVFLLYYPVMLEFTKLCRHLKMC